VISFLAVTVSLALFIVAVARVSTKIMSMHVESPHPRYTERFVVRLRAYRQRHERLIIPVSASMGRRGVYGVLLMSMCCWLSCPQGGKPMAMFVEVFVVSIVVNIPQVC
jgi:hypothetical protein